MIMSWTGITVGSDVTCQEFGLQLEQTKVYIHQTKPKFSLLPFRIPYLRQLISVTDGQSIQTRPQNKRDLSVSSVQTRT